MLIIETVQANSDTANKALQNEPTPKELLTFEFGYLLFLNVDIYQRLFALVRQAPDLWFYLGPTVMTTSFPLPLHHPLSTDDSAITGRQYTGTSKHS